MGYQADDPATGPEAAVTSLKTLLKGAGFAFVGLAFAKLAFYLFRIIVARTGSTDYGIYSIAYSLFSIVSMVAFLGVTTGLLRFIPEFRAKNDRKSIIDLTYSGFRITLVTSLLLGILMFISAEWIALNIFDNARLTQIIQIFAVAVPIYCLGVLMLTIARAFEKMKYEIITKLFGESIVKLGLAILFIYAGWGLFGISIAFLLSVIFSFLLALYFLEYKVMHFFREFKNAEGMERTLLNYSIPLLFAGIVFMFIAWTDVLLLGFFKGVEDVGTYNAALPTAALLLVFPQALNSLFLPVVVGLISKKQISGLSEVYRSLTKWVFILNIPITVMFILFARQALRVMFGAPYEVAAVPLQILAAGNLIYSLFFSSPDMLGALNRPKLVLQNMIVAAIVNVVLNLLLIPQYGISGAAVGTSASLAVYGLLSAYQVFGLTGLQPLRRNYFFILAGASAGIGIAFYLFKYLSIPSEDLNLLLLGAVYLIFYGAMVFLFRIFDSNDFRMLESIEKKAGLNLEFLKAPLRSYYRRK